LIVYKEYLVVIEVKYLYFSSNMSIIRLHYSSQCSFSIPGEAVNSEMSAALLPSSLLLWRREVKRIKESKCVVTILYVFPPVV
jgi:hypothetical protein